MNDSSIADKILTALQATTARAERIIGQPVAEVRKALERAFADGERRWPLWQVMEAEGLQTPEGLRLIEGFLISEPCLLLFNPKDEGSMFRFSRGSDVVPVLEGCSTFEFYVTDEVHSYCLSFSQYNVLTASGNAAAWLKEMKRGFSLPPREAGIIPAEDRKLAEERGVVFTVTWRQRRGLKWLKVEDGIESLDRAFEIARDALYPETSIWVRGFHYWGSYMPDLFNSPILDWSTNEWV